MTCDPTTLAALDKLLAAIRGYDDPRRAADEWKQAFRKRLSLMVLDEESKLGRNPLTKGAKSGIAGIVPPGEWPEPVWQELVRQGKLRHVGHGFYEPAKP